jgi:hypothetical protein
VPRLLVRGAFARRAAHDEVAARDENLSVTSGGCRAARHVIDLAIAVIVAEVAELELSRVHPSLVIVAVRAERATATVAIPVLVVATHGRGWPG